MAIACCLSANAQRTMENLDRGLVAVKTPSGVFTSWRISGTEYYDTQYNIFRDGTKINTEPLSVSNFQDTGGSESSVYTVQAIVRGVEQEISAPANVWNEQYLSIPMAKVYSPKGTDITSKYILNDASTADLDGDGEFEVIVKRIYEPDGLFEEANDSAFCLFEAYKLNGTKLWTIDCGPNLISSGHVETNLVAYDWDGDGKAEVVMRAADGTIIHGSDGDCIIGDPKKNYRNKILHAGNQTYAVDGDEFLLYMEGASAKLYNQRAFPLKRLENGESDLSEAWGDGYGHRANKFFFGAPYLDGRNPSIFLARGIYTRHKMIAYDVNPDTHELTVRWRWDNSSGGSWFGQGYHNYGIADVDWDGRDEIVYGSMVIDDNGKGLSTTGLGHGDAQHCSDLDPYRKGLEIFACNEDAKGANFRDATTSKIYYWYQHSGDCGRCMAGNFTDQYLGSQMIAGSSGLVSSVINKAVATSWSGITQDFRIYWDGDLCMESMDGDGTEGPAAVFKYGQSSPIFTATGTKMNNWTKNSPSFQADILGDWREEIIVRAEDNQSLRVYTTVNITPWRNYTLLHDMQYRQAVVWQMCGYNQPPHVSYFLGRAEGITMAPPPLINNGREEVTNAITTAQNDKHVLLSNPEGGEVTVAEGASPYILTVNAYSHTEGSTNNDGITTSYSAYTLKGGSFGGKMRLVKQGEGTLNFSGTHTYEGQTDLWGGVTNFEGALTHSDVWMNRFAELNTTAVFSKDITMEYGSVLRVGTTEQKSEAQVSGLTLKFGAIIVFDIFSEGIASDKIIIDRELTLKKIARTDGPQYQAPVFRFVQHAAEGETKVAPGKYCIADVTSIVGDLSNVIVEGMDGVKCHLESDESHIYLVVEEIRKAGTVYWNGTAENNVWDLALTENFNNEGEKDVFVTGDQVIFDDAATETNVKLEGEVIPSQVSFEAEQKDYVLSGSGAIAGEAGLVKKGTSTLTIETTNKYTGKTLLEGGTTVVAQLADDLTPYGAFGAYTEEQGKIEIKNGAVLKNTVAVSTSTPITIGEGGAEINCAADFNQKAKFVGKGVLTKTGKGRLSVGAGNVLDYTVVKAGTLAASADNVNFGDTIILDGGNYHDCDNLYSYSSNSNNFCVRSHKTAILYLDSRCFYTGKLYGEGTLKVNVPNVRTQLQGDWSKFEGTLEPINASRGLTLDNGYGIPRATLNIPADMYVSNSGKAYTIGKLTGKGTLGGYNSFSSSGSGTNTWKIGSLNDDFTFAGKISGATTKFEKVGTGIMTVTGASDFEGSALISDGTLCVNNLNATEAMLGKGTLTVANGAVLCGQGALGNSTVTIQRYGMLRPGLNENSVKGTLDFMEKNVIVNSNAIVQFYASRKFTYTKLTGIEKLIVRTGAVIRVLLKEGITLSDGDEFRLWEANTVEMTTEPVLELDEPGEGLTWDTTELEKGILRVKTGTGIHNIASDEEVACEVYTVSGVRMGQFECSYQEVRGKIRSAYGKGTYMVKLKTASAEGTEKMMIR